MTATVDSSLGRSAIGVVAVLAVVVGLGWGTAGDDPGATGDGATIVLVSGRDDHGMEVADELALHDAPDGTEVGTIAADTLVEVHETRGTWLRISSLEGATAQGWIDEFLVRGELHVVLPDAPACPAPTAEGELPPSARVRVVDVHPTGRGIEVGVMPVTGDREHHVDRAWVRELPGPAPAPGGNCAEVPDVPGPAHRH